MIPEYIIMTGSITALAFIALLVQRHSLLNSANREDWQDLNEMMSRLYHDNDGLRADLQRAAKQVALLQSVNGNLKNTIDDLSLHKTELIDEMSKLKRAIDNLEHEINCPPEPQPDLDELDSWQDEDRSHIPPSTDLFKAISSSFFPPQPDNDE